VIVTASVTTLVLRERPPAVHDVAAEWVAGEAAYVGAVRELEKALAGAMAELAPETAALIEDNLRVIDEAIRESRAVLAADPGNRDVLPFLASMYEKKLDVLQQISRSSSL
jgi:xanthine dehydrogenase molybdopterin-binding subunit B